MKIREEHDGAWESPENQRGNLPNEMFFVRRTEGRLTGKELRGEEEGFQTEDAKGLIQDFHMHNFNSLCRGEVSVKSTAPKLPLCRLTHKNDDYFRLQPLKEEEISFDPPIAVFHEFLTEAEMRLMKNQVMPDLLPAMVIDTGVADGSGSKMSNERTQASGWLWDHDHPSLYRLSRKVGRLSNMEVARPQNEWKGSIVEAEPFQIGLYSPGGHYLPHYDAFDVLDPQSRTPEGLWVGNR